jgi:hypothetical protein
MFDCLQQSVFCLKLGGILIAVFPLSRESLRTADLIHQRGFQQILSPATFLVLVPSFFGEHISRLLKESCSPSQYLENTVELSNNVLGKRGGFTVLTPSDEN